MPTWRNFVFGSDAEDVVSRMGRKRTPIKSGMTTDLKPLTGLGVANKTFY